MFLLPKALTNDDDVLPNANRALLILAWRVPQRRATLSLITVFLKQQFHYDFGEEEKKEREMITS